MYDFDYFLLGSNEFPKSLLDFRDFSQLPDFHKRKKRTHWNIFPLTFRMVGCLAQIMGNMRNQIKLIFTESDVDLPVSHWVPIKPVRQKQKKPFKVF